MMSSCKVVIVKNEEVYELKMTCHMVTQLVRSVAKVSKNKSVLAWLETWRVLWVFNGS